MANYESAVLSPRLMPKQVLRPGKPLPSQLPENRGQNHGQAIAGRLEGCRFGSPDLTITNLDFRTGELVMEGPGWGTHAQATIYTQHR